MINIIIDPKIKNYIDENGLLIGKYHITRINNSSKNRIFKINKDDDNFFKHIKELMLYLMSLNVLFIIDRDYEPCYDYIDINIVNDLIKLDYNLMRKYGEFMLAHLEKIVNLYDKIQTHDYNQLVFLRESIYIVFFMKSDYLHKMYEIGSDMFMDLDYLSLLSIICFYNHYDVSYLDFYFEIIKNKIYCNGNSLEEETCKRLGKNLIKNYGINLFTLIYKHGMNKYFEKIFKTDLLDIIDTKNTEIKYIFGLLKILLILNEIQIIKYLEKQNFFPNKIIDNEIEYMVIIYCEQDIFEKLIKNDCCESFDYVLRNYQYSESDLKEVLCDFGDKIGYDFIVILENNGLLHEYINDLIKATKNNPDKKIRRYLKNYNKILV